MVAKERLKIFNTDGVLFYEIKSIKVSKNRKMGTNEIKKEAIKFIESIEHIRDVDITWGLRDTTPLDDNYCEWANTRTHDGSFVMVIRGNRYK